jgi:hypothetical protein
MKNGGMLDVQAFGAKGGFCVHVKLDQLVALQREPNIESSATTRPVLASSIMA